MTACLDYSSNIISQFSTLVDLLGTRAENQPDQIAYIFLENGETESAQLNYQDLNRQAQALGASLQSLVAPGERVLLLYPPGLEFIAAFFGCLYAGVVAVPAYPPRRNQKMSRLEAIVADAQATVALTTTSVLGNIQGKLTENPELASLRWLATDNIGSDRANQWQEPALTTKTLAFLQYTSGSTGTPKGVMVSHGNLLHNEQMIQQAFGHTADTIVVGWLPFYHDMGLIGNVLQPLYLGKPVILMPPVAFLQKPIRWLQAISRYKATTSGGPNFAYDLCVNKIKPEQLTGLDLSSWRVAFSGAEPVLPQTLERFANYFAPCGFRSEAFYPCYGMAETTLLVSGGLKTAEPMIRLVDGAALSQNKVVQSTDHNEEVRGIVGCGRSWLNQKIAIANPESKIQCPDGQVGEIWVSGSSVAMGYWRKPQKTQETFHAYLADSQEGPFLRTGDLGFLLDGELFVTGRIKDVIIIRGQNHYPQDIELTVQKSHPALRPNCGAAFTMEFNGSERLVIVQEVERSYLRKLDVNQVVGNILQAVTAEHALKVYAIVLVKTGSIPKTSSGKIRRQACRAEFITGSLNVVGDWSQNPLGKAKFRHLQADVESLLQKLQTCK
ncbi:fatty acyl-AMP ligase [Moorena producens JHB]|uniref:Fatty acyl-AMP ligase n=1 Tax=Moorena producens (strain JHB) TaxID=1454205 RepID=A0A1D9G4A8_MOOP1|nr:fatty acyl-AMP ligase [Moorena producens]AOY82446.1 fatty acyl-AMP ligase [Moorena producens JHB]